MSLFLAATILPALQAAAAQARGERAAPPRAPGEIAAAAPAREWRRIPPADLLVIDLSPDANGRPRRIVIQLIPAPFAAGWVANVRRLATAHWWDGTSVNRVQDNYVAQWGDASERKPLPAGLATVAERDYVVDLGATTVEGGEWRAADRRLIGRVVGQGTDSYAQVTAITPEGFPIAAGARTAGALDTTRTAAWPVHCYGSVGVGRDLSPNTGSGAELYAVIGHAPRHLDRNIAVVGRVVDGIEHLSSLPRGTGALGFYERAEERVPIVRVRLASELPAADRPRIEYLPPAGATWAVYQRARENREPPFFRQPAGGADVCNVPVPTRRAK